MTVEITNSKTFAVDQTVTLTLSGTATQGTHYSVSPGTRIQTRRTTRWFW